MNLLIDTNILLDVLQKREPFFEASVSVWRRCERGAAYGWISAMSVPDIVYILRKELTPAKTAEVYESLSMLFRIAALIPADLALAADMRWKDYENAVQAATAERLGCDAIITRSVRDYEGSSVPAVTPEDFLKSLGTPERPD